MSMQPVQREVPSLAGLAASTIVHNAVEGEGPLLTETCREIVDAKIQEIATSYLERYTNVNAAFLQAASEGKFLVLRYFLTRCHANINIKDGNGRTALMRTTLWGHNAVVRMLLDAEADVNASVNGRTALMWAAENGHDAVAQILRDAGAQA